MFWGANGGLILIELKLKSPHETISLPPVLWRDPIVARLRSAGGERVSTSWRWTLHQLPMAAPVTRH